MAEFSEVMRQWGRYCKGYLENHNDDCDDCPFKMDGSCNSYVKDNVQHAKQIEELIMIWAARYPEPVYPTWREWLIELGIVSFDANFRTLSDIEPTTFKNTVRAYINEEGSKPIPADIARKLGLKPKEVK